VRIAKEKIAELASARGYSLSRLLRESGVSRTAYYSLVGRDTILPKSVHAIAGTLGVRPREIVSDDAGEDHERALVLLREAKKICAADREASFENVWHTLCLLESPPADRLNRSLIRGRAGTVYR
jgi:lambda repressor-like predicted transcriptional regulator